MIVAPINGLFRSLIEIFWIATIFFIWNTKLAIIAIILTIPIYFLAKKIGEVSKRKFGEISVINDDLNQYTLSILKNSKVIHTSKTYQKEIISASNFINDSYIKNKQLNKALSTLFPSIDFLKIIGTIIIFIQSYIMAKEGLMSVGDIMIAYIYVQRFFNPIVGMSRYFESISKADKSLTRLFEIDDFNYQGNQDAKLHLTKPPLIEFINLSTNYGKRNIFQNITTSIEPGSLILLKSQSGKGKSTIINILLSLKSEYKGEILINKVESKLYDISDFSIAFQESPLFNRGFFENVTYGNPEIDSVTLNETIDLLGLKNLILDKNFIIEHESKNISGGEKRRISFLRSILKNSFLYIFDEPTRELDLTYSKVVVDLILQKKGQATIIISTYDNIFDNVVDKIIYLD